jgi:hypothetical protein
MLTGIHINKKAKCLDTSLTFFLAGLIAVDVYKNEGVAFCLFVEE